MPSYLAVAFGEIGVREDTLPGRSNPRIARYHGVTAGGEAVDDVAWCASFLGYCLEMGGMKSTKSKAAVSYASYGTATLYRFGCILVFGKTDPDAKGSGHVGFGIGLTGHTVYCLGGNQSDGVTIAARDIRDVRTLRWPTA
jgi:uncharacterized protein (TIGR02594 family)